MSAFTLHDLQCFDAVIHTGGFQAAATALHRSHPAVFAAVAKLESQLGLQLLDRSGYRVRATDAGRAFHRRAQALLHEMDGLRTYAAQLAMGEESELAVVIGDLCPLPQTLGLLGRFFAQSPDTRLHLHVEAVTGPWERLFDGDADLILHRVDKSDTRLEWIDLGDIDMVPVVAPGFLPAPVTRGPVTRAIDAGYMKNFTQCIIRDTARHSVPQDFFVIEGAPRYTVADQLMKKEIIVQGLGWGHLPHNLIEEELNDGRLLSIAGDHFPGRREALVAARRRDRPHGPVANRLWQHLREAAPLIAPPPTKRRKRRAIDA